jgi:hypothetical protein
MATKAQTERSTMERKGGGARAKKSRGGRTPDAAHTADRKNSPRAARKAAVALEDSTNGRATRKSTRDGSAAHGRTDVGLKNRQTMRSRSPSARAQARKTTS